MTNSAVNAHFRHLGQLTILGGYSCRESRVRKEIDRESKSVNACYKDAQKESYNLFFSPANMGLDISVGF